MSKQNNRELLIEKRIKPHKIRTYSDGTFSEYWFNKHGELHSINSQPSLVAYYKNKEMEYKSWHKNNKQIKSETYILEEKNSLRIYYIINAQRI